MSPAKLQISQQKRSKLSQSQKGLSPQRSRLSLQQAVCYRHTPLQNLLSCLFQSRTDHACKAIQSVAEDTHSAERIPGGHCQRKASPAFDQGGRWDSTKAHQQQVRAKEKKAEQRCKQRPQGAEPLKAKISSLIYKQTCMNRQPHQQGDPGDAPPVPPVTGYCSPPREENGHVPCHIPSSQDHISCLLPVLGLWVDQFTPRGTRAQTQPDSLSEGVEEEGVFVPSFCTFLMLCFPRTAL